MKAIFIVHEYLYIGAFDTTKEKAMAMVSGIIKIVAGHLKYNDRSGLRRGTP